MENLLKLSIVIPAFNEETCLASTIHVLESYLIEKLTSSMFEVVVVDDLSTDSTFAVGTKLQAQYPNITLLKNQKEKGFGGAVRFGLEAAKGEAVIVYTADGSDNPEDVFRFLSEFSSCHCDFVIGDRFSTPGLVQNYPRFKLLFNRLGNFFLSTYFSVPCRDITNSFKLYRLSFLRSLKPLKSIGFELTLEMALKSLLASQNYRVLDNSWKDRETGVSKMKVLKTSLKYLKISHQIKNGVL